MQVQIYKFMRKKTTKNIAQIVRRMIANFIAQLIKAYYYMNIFILIRT